MTGGEPSEIDARLDVYGGRERPGAIADYLEAAALAGRRMTRDDLVDLATTLDWSRKRRRQVLVEAGDAERDPEAWPDQAFAAIDERADLLGPDYPFETKRGALVYRGSPDRLSDRYLAVLAISVVHAWRLPSTVDPKVVLEDVAARVLETRRLGVARMGTADRGGVGFVDNLQASAAALGLRAMTDPVPRPASAQDVGVDTLAALVWQDRRPGQWVMIGQVTCANSTEWRTKLAEPVPGLWADYLQERLFPQPFLVVPHHVDARHLTELLS